MKVVYDDLLNFFSKKPSIEKVSERLFQLGHEHEIHDDILDMELTPNRGDCLSLIGLARDLNIYFNYSENLSLFEGNFEPLEINFVNSSPEDCPKISFLEIEIEEPTSKYMPYLEKYLNSVGGNKTNLFTDISNYISYEMGQPTHCFDLDVLNGDFVFENRICNSIFKTVLGSEIKLKEENCVFSLGNEIVSLAGIMGGASTACHHKTKKVLIECAYFKPESIIGKSIKYNLISDAAHKFERGVDHKCQEKVLRRFTKLVSDHAKIKTIKLKSFISSDIEDVIIPKDINKIIGILGIDLEETEYNNYLSNLGFQFENNIIKVPSYRGDIKTQNDLAEEIARVIGYNNINSKPINIKKIKEAKKNNKLNIIESYLTLNGFSEIINFPFTSKEDLESIKIDNPLDSTKGKLRTSLRDSLVENLLYNERRQKDSIKLFEIADIYTKDNKEIKLKKKLGIIVSGRMGNNYNEFSRKLDYNYLNELININLNNHSLKISQIHRDSLDTKKKEKIFYIEVAIDDIPDKFFSHLDIIGNEKPINFISYTPVSEYPSSTRDFSFSITNLLNVTEVIEALNGISDEIIKDSFIFDFYKNGKTKTVKLGYRFIFQSSTKTLSDKEINAKIYEILQPILNFDGVSIPGMNLKNN